MQGQVKELGEANIKIEKHNKEINELKNEKIIKETNQQELEHKVVYIEKHKEEIE